MWTHHIRASYGEYTQVSLPPANEVCEGYVFTGVCLSTRGGVLVSVQGALCPGAGHCPGGSLSRVGGLCQGDKETPWTETPPYGNKRTVPTGIHSCSLCTHRDILSMSK